MRTPKKTGEKKSARGRVMDLLARRNYSERELKTKLSKDYPAVEIDAAIQAAREDKWMLPDKELSERVAASLTRKKKGHRYINQYLKLKGLPPVAQDAEAEFAKGRTIIDRAIIGRAIVEAKLARRFTDEKDRSKARRLLANRGYDNETIRRVLESFRAKI